MNFQQINILYIISLIVLFMTSIVSINYLSMTLFKFNYIPNNKVLYIFIGINGILLFIMTIISIKYMNNMI